MPEEEWLGSLFSSPLFNSLAQCNHPHNQPSSSHLNDSRHSCTQSSHPSTIFCKLAPIPPISIHQPHGTPSKNTMSFPWSSQRATSPVHASVTQCIVQEHHVYSLGAGTGGESTHPFKKIMLSKKRQCLSLGVAIAGPGGGLHSLIFYYTSTGIFLSWRQSEQDDYWEHHNMDELSHNLHWKQLCWRSS